MLAQTAAINGVKRCGMFALVSRYQTLPKNNSMWQHHLVYITILLSLLAEYKCSHLSRS